MNKSNLTGICRGHQRSSEEDAGPRIGRGQPEAF